PYILSINALTQIYNQDKKTTNTSNPVSPLFVKASTKLAMPPSGSIPVLNNTFAKTKNIIAALTTPVNPLKAPLIIESHEAMLFLLD
ncbi:MAG: hypothetical protein VX207_00235, partial [Candidatus Neomarinimicrobiota bacterium]|nr:hypothetical protein [Candidatus Neomarinimicrobiota bacterium]